jgi:hypothetical protein
MANHLCTSVVVPGDFAPAHGATLATGGGSVLSRNSSRAFTIISEAIRCARAPLGVTLHSSTSSASSRPRRPTWFIRTMSCSSVSGRLLMDTHPLRRILRRQSRGTSLNERMIAESANATGMSSRGCFWRRQTTQPAVSGATSFASTGSTPAQALAVNSVPSSRKPSIKNQLVVCYPDSEGRR